VDPLGTVIPWIVVGGSLGLLGVTLLERLVPILPSKALLVANGSPTMGAIGWGMISRPMN
jgi:hypothetical protein